MLPLITAALQIRESPNSQPSMKATCPEYGKERHDSRPLEINRQIRADNKMLRELKAKVAKLAEAVEKSIPIIAETLEAIRNHMIFIQYHLLHNEMQKK